eukprot:gene12640-3348_t
MDALQYLSGYVMHVLVRKVYKFSEKKCKQSQVILSLLYAAKSDNVSAQRLVASQTRGGLLSVTPECVQVFRLVEEEFRKITSAAHIPKIDVKEISETLTHNVDIVSAFDTMVHVETDNKSTVTAKVSDYKCNLLVDTEASVNILDEETFRQIPSDLQL